MQVAAVIDRLSRAAPSLRKVEGAAELTSYMATQNKPPAGITAFVVPTGLRGGEVTSASTLYVQMVEEVVTVILIMRHADRTGAAALPKIEAAIDECITAVAGWGPDDAPGTFRLRSGAPFSFSGDMLAYQIEFAIMDQLRITP